MAETTRAPWWLRLIVGSLGIGAGAAGAVCAVLGLSSAPARGQEPRLAQAAVVAQAQPGALSLDTRLERIERAIDKLQRAWDKLPERCKPKSTTEPEQ